MKSKKLKKELMQLIRPKNVITVTTEANGFALNQLLFRLVLQATTIDRGLVNVIPAVMDKVFINTFRADAELIAPVPTPTTGDQTGTIDKDFVEIPVGDMMYYKLFNPLRDFQEDWTFFYATGKLTDAQAAPKIRQAIEKVVVEQVNKSLENIIWNGDVAGGAGELALFDGYILLIEAEPLVNVVTPTGVITKSNIFQLLDDMILTTPDDVLELSTPRFIMSHRDKQIYYSALRDGSISKGVNIQDAGVNNYGGVQIVSTGIPKDHLLLANANTGSDSALALATWMNADRSGSKIELLQANSEEWFAKMLVKMGVNITNPDQITYYKPV